MHLLGFICTSFSKCMPRSGISGFWVYVSSTLPGIVKFFPKVLIPIYIPAAAAAKSLQSCLTLCDPIDGTPPGSSVPGILQARVLEWGAIAFSKNGILFNYKKKQTTVLIYTTIWINLLDIILTLFYFLIEV